jgi:pullulanase-type alpha-1,6-glucosidase
MDWIRVGMAGNLRGYQFVDRFGRTVSGGQVDYNGQPAGYTEDPQEDINYVEAHDNETLFDVITYKAPINTTMADRVRMQNLGIDILSLGQGIPSFHAGVDMLRSKSFDRDSYNSGDWFNRLDFSYMSNNFGVGLPPEQHNRANWPLMQPLLANPSLKPQQADILQAAVHFREMLRIRKSSRLFRLRTADAIQAQLKFLNTGPEQRPGMIVMHLSTVEMERDDAPDPYIYRQIVVLLNATGQMQTFSAADLAGAGLRLHPIQETSYDPVVRTASFDQVTGTFAVPARTTAVFVEPGDGDEDEHS